MKKYLIIIKQAPYNNSLGLEALEFSLAIAAFSQEVSLLFKGDGILQLLKNQTPNLLAYKDFTKAYTGLNLFGINDVYICKDSISKYNNTDLIIEPKIVDENTISELIKNHNVVLEL